MTLEVTGRYRYPTPRADWLAQSTEAVIAPEQRIVDAHHHLWVEDGQPYLLDAFVGDLASGHRVVASVFVQAHYGYDHDAPAHLAPVGETRAVASIADAAIARLPDAAVAAGIVAFADLTGDRLEEVLDAHAQAADGRFRGIRHSVSYDPAFPKGIVIRPANPGLLAEPAYRSGLRTLAARGLSYDAMLYHGQITELAAAARAVPDLQIVLDHAGCRLGIGPYEATGETLFTAWRRDMAELAACPNVSVKLGGFGMIITGACWHERAAPPSSDELAVAWQPAIDTCIDLFGPDRCMFESNFPVDKAMYSYRTLWNAFKRATAKYGQHERDAMFAGTAARVYRLGVVAHG